MTHSRGSHADDPNDTEPCYCEEEIAARKLPTEAEQVIIDLVMQDCDVKEKKTVWEIYHRHISSYERATAYLFYRGFLKEKKRGVVYTMSKKIKF